MILKRIESEWFQDYKHPSMLIAFPCCSFKCEKENEGCCCQNSSLATSPNIDIEVQEIIDSYQENPLTSAIIMGGLEPLDSWNDLQYLIRQFRAVTNDLIIIYTGYYKHEVPEQFEILKQYPNIIVKWGRYIPNSEKHWDETLGVYLASNNQYAERVAE